MSTFAENLIRTLGGTTAVSRMTEAPTSTVHSWKKMGVPQARLAHIKLAAQAAGIEVDWTTGLPPVPSDEAEAGAEAA
jgi:hypothetical protein